ncbi:MAG: hypothetical protein F6K36_14725 [Symploca sp. SIO3C6]|uniref:PepSY domain-containing protein n=1 Tax=Symploca sp. SIO1C4 TaxID=2607765 RepID=A0A6B3ND02_9CYAN|nr:hypothetical protein [Symploca sp. SIO3C6]NER27521.1 hypothetical protein [Symploca sp. SIO1C4]NET03681.1 hypothetical protein [Symploca sp. SIO2B6]
MDNFLKNTRRVIVATTGMVALTSSVYLGSANAQSLTNTETFLIAQTLGGIQRKISLSEVPFPVMSSVQAVAGTEPSYAGVELKPDGSLTYELGGQNQQGFKFEVEVTPEGRIIEVDEQVERSAVPETVFKAFDKWLPNYEVREIWRSTRLGEFVYELGIPDFWVEVSADGSRLSILKADE